jgi:hypothetical protein
MRHLKHSEKSSKTSKTSKSTVDRAKALPWALMLQAGFVVGNRLSKLTSAERERLMKLLRDSGGRLNRLTEKERKELGKIAAKLDVRGMSGELLPLFRGGRGRHGRRG